MGKKNLTNDAKIVPSTANEPEVGQTLCVKRSGLKGARWSILIIAVPIVAFAGILTASRLSDSDAVALEVPTVETVTDKPADSNAAVSPPVCQGDLSQASEQRQWYCNGFMPWKQAVDAELARLDGRGGGTSVTAWILIVMLLAANGVVQIVTWIMLLPRRKKQGSL